MRSFVQAPVPESLGTTAPVAAGLSTAIAEAAPTTTTAVAIPSRSTYVEGDVDKSDIKTPYLSCVQAVGPKSVLFSPGSLVLGEVAITPPPAAPPALQVTGRLRVVFCKVSKTYVENLEYNNSPGAPRPRVLGKREEVIALGGTTEWKNNVRPSWIAKTTSLILVRCPADFEDGQFNIIAGDKAYAPAMLSLQKTSYPAAKTLWTDLSLSLKNDPTATFYDLFYVREQKGPNFVWCAKLVRVRDEKPLDTLTAIAKKLGGGNLSFDDSTEVE